MEEIEFETFNKNSLWLDNILENIKNVEVMMRLASEGCNSITEYLQIPFERKHAIIADTQYKNLRLIITELKLLITDAEVIIGKEKADSYFATLFKLSENIDNKKLFVKEKFSMTKGVIIYAKTTELFNITLEYVQEIRRELIRDLSAVFYVKKEKRKELPLIL